MADDFRLEWDGDRVLAALSDASMDGLLVAGEHLLQESSTLVPHEEGDLERSGEVTTDPGSGTVAVSYDRPYAGRQHEDMTLRHDDGRQAKYLEQPMTTEWDVMLALIAQAAGKPLKG
ncbi:minor capsid protein [Salinispora pacifica]|uniref:minor capsid protein n=1 Tax=Salinispora pacifica TaxID=351187 RepID=UPI00037298FA|nr:minor capsid protein [Salinispora pacifica]